jgi:hypothetical protein
MQKVLWLLLRFLVVLPAVLGVPYNEAFANQKEASRPKSKTISVSEPVTILIGLGDSLTHGTMDGVNNYINTLNAYLQKIADSLAQVTPLVFAQPLYTVKEKRLVPYVTPTNLGVNGSDAFSLEGIQYYKRVGANSSFLTGDYLCDRLLPKNFQDDYDKVLYPINVLAGQPVSQIDAANWLLAQNQSAFAAGQAKGLILFWIGNNDSSLAALGSGGQNPTFLPIPFEQIEPELSPALSFLLRLGQSQGDLSFAPYTQTAIERNLTELQDFVDQYNRLLTLLGTDRIPSATPVELFLLTLPYYSSVAYLFDSEDLEYYLQKLNPAYVVPPTFKRVAPLGEPITDPIQGDRVSLFTFGVMYTLLGSGYPVDYVNQILEINGQQQDGLILSEEEQRFIMSRIDDFNDTIKAAATTHGPHVHLIDVGSYLNDLLTGKIQITLDGRVFNRKWIRGGGFSLDGVHPGYVGQTLIANFILEQLNLILGLQAPLHDTSFVLLIDPYRDQDGDGWAPGSDYEASGLSQLLFLFEDPDDGNSSIQPVLPLDIWERISDALLGEILKVPSVRIEAIRSGIALAPKIK